MVMGRVMVIPMPTAGPWMAPMVGFVQWWIASAARPPLGEPCVSMYGYTQKIAEGTREPRTGV